MREPAEEQPMRCTITTVAGILALLVSVCWVWVPWSLLAFVWQLGVDEARCDAQGGCDLLGDPVRPAARGTVLPDQPTGAWMIAWLILVLVAGAPVVWGVVAGANLIRRRRWACWGTAVPHLAGAVLTGAWFSGAVGDADATPAALTTVLAMFGASATVVVLAVVCVRASTTGGGRSSGMARERTS
jgi:hypothetical protein